MGCFCFGKLIFFKFVEKYQITKEINKFNKLKLTKDCAGNEIQKAIFIHYERSFSLTIINTFVNL